MEVLIKKLQLVYRSHVQLGCKLQLPKQLAKRFPILFCMRQSASLVLREGPTSSALTIAIRVIHLLQEVNSQMSMYIRERIGSASKFIQPLHSKTLN
jgi:hypothetical protein